MSLTEMFRNYPNSIGWNVANSPVSYSPSPMETPSFYPSATAGRMSGF